VPAFSLYFLGLHSHWPQDRGRREAHLVSVTDRGISTAIIIEHPRGAPRVDRVTGGEALLHDNQPIIVTECHRGIEGDDEVEDSETAVYFYGSQINLSTGFYDMYIIHDSTRNIICIIYRIAEVAK
jgi:hypothetical protein